MVQKTFYFIKVTQERADNHKESILFVGNNGSIEPSSMDAWDIKEYGFDSKMEARLGSRRLKRFYKRIGASWKRMNIVSTIVFFQEEDAIRFHITAEAQ
jgi:hypothetical protein